MISGMEEEKYYSIDQQNNQEVYQEMKNNQINRKQLIDMLRNEENPYSNSQDRELWSKQITDIKSQYTLQSINNCSDFDFLILLM